MYCNTSCRLQNYYINYKIIKQAHSFSKYRQEVTNNLDEDYGQLEIKLAELMEKKGLNRYKLSHKANMSWNQINGYYCNSITRLDTFVLCKLCTVLECEIQDLLVFHQKK